MRLRMAADTNSHEKFSLKAGRLNRGLSLEALARETGVARHVLHYAEQTGGMPRRREDAFAIASFYELQVTDLWPLETAA